MSRIQLRIQIFNKIHLFFPSQLAVVRITIARRVKRALIATASSLANKSSADRTPFVDQSTITGRDAIAWTGIEAIR